MKRSDAEKKVIVEYHQNRCIGAQECLRAAPQHFSFENEKAVLLHSTLQDGRNVLRASFDEQQLSQLKKAAELCPVNALKISDDQGQVLVSDTVEIDPGKLREIRAEYDDQKEFIMDEKGYFLIRINPPTNDIEVAFCPQLNKITIKITGKKPLEIYQSIIKAGFLSRMDHAAYLGRELQKAYLALHKNIPYVQDSELEF